MAAPPPGPGGIQPNGPPQGSPFGIPVPQNHGGRSRSGARRNRRAYPQMPSTPTAQPPMQPQPQQPPSAGTPGGQQPPSAGTPGGQPPPQPTMHIASLQQQQPPAQQGQQPGVPPLSQASAMQPTSYASAGTAAVTVPSQIPGNAQPSGFHPQGHSQQQQAVLAQPLVDNSWSAGGSSMGGSSASSAHAQAPTQLFQANTPQYSQTRQSTQPPQLEARDQPAPSGQAEPSLQPPPQQQPQEQQQPIQHLQPEFSHPPPSGQAAPSVQHLQQQPQEQQQPIQHLQPEFSHPPPSGQAAPSVQLSRPQSTQSVEATHPNTSSEAIHNESQTSVPTQNNQPQNFDSFEQRQPETTQEGASIGTPSEFHKPEPSQNNESAPPEQASTLFQETALSGKQTLSQPPTASQLFGATPSTETNAPPLAAALFVNPENTTQSSSAASFFGSGPSDPSVSLFSSSGTKTPEGDPEEGPFGFNGFSESEAAASDVEGTDLESNTTRSEKRNSQSDSTIESNENEVNENGRAPQDNEDVVTTSSATKVASGVSREDAVSIAELLRAEREQMAAESRRNAELIMAQFQEMRSQMEEMAEMKAKATAAKLLEEERARGSVTSPPTTTILEFGDQGVDTDMLQAQVEEQEQENKQREEQKAAEDAQKRRHELQVRLAELRRVEEEEAMLKLEAEVRSREQAAQERLAQTDGLATTFDINTVVAESTTISVHAEFQADDSALATGVLAVPGEITSSEFVEYFTAEGLPYYYNEVTGETVWEPPTDYILGPFPPGPFMDDGLPDMRYKRNQQWYRDQGIEPNDTRYGKNLDEEESPDLDMDAPSDADLDEFEYERKAQAARPVTPPPRPCHPLVSFGFGGRLVVMFPTSMASPNKSLVISTDNELEFNEVSFTSTQDLSQTDIQTDGNTNEIHVQGSVDGDAGPVSIYKLGDILHDDPVYSQLLKSFPGPFTSPEDVQESIVEEYASQMAGQAQYDNDASLVVLWRLLKLLCRHHGSLKSARRVNQAKNTDPIIQDVVAMLQETRRNQQPIQRGEIVTATANGSEHFHVLQTLVLSGNKLEACEYASSRGMWDHAFIIASQISQTTLNGVVMKFAKAACYRGAPLEYLYTLYANGGPPPPPAKYPLYDDLDQWTEVLATILSNPTSGDSTMIRHMGDSLRARGDVSAAHVCYICADELPGSRWESVPRMVLVGHEHKDCLPLAVGPLCIQRTEILEYCQNLRGNAPVRFPSFYIYKFLFAGWLSEAGQTSTAMKYCDAIAAEFCDLARDDILQKYSRSFITLLEDLAFRLRGHCGRVSGKSKLDDFWTGGIKEILRDDGWEHVPKTKSMDGIPKTTPAEERLSDWILPDQNKVVNVETSPDVTESETTGFGFPQQTIDTGGDVGIATSLQSSDQPFVQNTQSEGYQFGYYEATNAPEQPNLEFSNQQTKYTYEGQNRITQPFLQVSNNAQGDEATLAVPLISTEQMYPSGLSHEESSSINDYSQGPSEVAQDLSQSIDVANFGEADSASQNATLEPESQPIPMFQQQASVPMWQQPMQPVTQPIQTIAQPDTQSIAQPIAQPVTQPVAPQITQPFYNAGTQPGIQPPSDSVWNDQPDDQKATAQTNLEPTVHVQPLDNTIETNSFETPKKSGADKSEKEIDGADSGNGWFSSGKKSDSDSGNKDRGSGGGGWFTSLKDRLSGTQAKLGDSGVAFKYDEDLKQWVPTDPEAREKWFEEFNKKAAPPPPPGGASATANTNNSTAGSNTLVTGESDAALTSKFVDPIAAMMDTKAKPLSRRAPGRRRKPQYVGTGLSKGAAAPDASLISPMSVPKPMSIQGMNFMVPGEPITDTETNSAVTEDSTPSS